MAHCDCGTATQANLPVLLWRVARKHVPCRKAHGMMPWWVPILTIACLVFVWWAAGALSRWHERMEIRALVRVRAQGGHVPPHPMPGNPNPPPKQPNGRPRHRVYGRVRREFVHPVTGVSQVIEYGAKPHIRQVNSLPTWSCGIRDPHAAFGRDPLGAYDEWVAQVWFERMLRHQMGRTE